MSNSQPTTAIFIDRYHPKADGRCAVSIRITHDRKKKYYATPVAVSPQDFSKIMGDKPRNEYKAIALKLQSFEQKAISVIHALPHFTWSAFEKQYLTNRASGEIISAAFSDYALQLRAEKRIGTAVSYECAKSSLDKFAPGALFSDVTPEFLRKYETWMLQQGNSLTTVGIYLRSLRTLFNIRLNDGLLKVDYYPFGKRKYEIPTGSNLKKSLSLYEISLLYYHQPEPGSLAAMRKDLWWFMYVGNGINVKDLCLLKYENIKGDYLEFERAKTVRTKRKAEPIRIVLDDDLKAIIKRWGNVHKDGSTFIFPILTKHLSAEKERQLIQQFTQGINKTMKRIAMELGIHKATTTYVARHSFATILQRANVGTQFIKQALGHSSVATTEKYLAGFEDDVKKETVKALTAFKIPPKLEVA